MLSSITVPGNGRGTESDIEAPSGGLELGAIIGIVFGLLVVLILGVAILMVALFLVRRRKTGGKQLTANNDIGLSKNPHEIVHMLHDFFRIAMTIPLQQLLGNRCNVNRVAIFGRVHA